MISPGNTQTYGVLELAKRAVPPIEQMMTDPVGRYAVLALYAPSVTLKNRRIDRKMVIRKIKKSLYKKITRKNNLILLDDFKMTLGNKDRSGNNKGFCES